MPRYKPLKYIPKSFNFSEFDEFQIEDLAEVEKNLTDDYEMEELLVGVLKSLPTDKYRVIFLLLVLRNNGYEIPHEAVYKEVLKVHRSWYFRMINRMKKVVDALNRNRS